MSTLCAKRECTGSDRVVSTCVAISLNLNCRMARSLSLKLEVGGLLSGRCIATCKTGVSNGGVCCLKRRQDFFTATGCGFWAVCSFVPPLSTIFSFLEFA